MVILVDKIRKLIKVSVNRGYLGEIQEPVVITSVTGKEVTELLLSRDDLAFFLLFKDGTSNVFNFGRTLRRSDSLNVGLSQRVFSLTDCTGYVPQSGGTLNKFFLKDGVTPRVLRDSFEAFPAFYPSRFTTADGSIVTEPFFTTLNELVPKEDYFNSDIPFMFIEDDEVYSIVPILKDGELIGMVIHSDTIDSCLNLKSLFEQHDLLN